MLNWVEILRRILSLYNVRTQQELGMALGVPVSIGMDENADDKVVPWPILELVVMEKKVSWDWLLTGSGRPGAGGDPAIATPAPAAASAPAEEGERPVKRRFSIETRELERRLLDGDRSRDAEAGRSGDESCDAAMVRELEEIKAAMQEEIARVSKILEERGG